MKLIKYVSLTAAVFIVALGLYAGGAYALERTVSFDKVNYVSLQQMGKKYNLAVTDEGKEVRLVGDSVNLVVSKNSNVHKLNDKEVLGQESTRSHEGESWITAKDWATIFNLALTHYDGVSEMSPAKSEPTLNNEPYDDGSYRISSEWGEKTPDAVRKHGNITEITTPVIEFDTYGSKHRNSELESQENIQTIGQK